MRVAWVGGFALDLLIAGRVVVPADDSRECQRNQDRERDASDTSNVGLVDTAIQFDERPEEQDRRQLAENSVDSNSRVWNRLDILQLQA